MNVKRKQAIDTLSAAVSNINDVKYRRIYKASASCRRLLLIPPTRQNGKSLPQIIKSGTRNFRIFWTTILNL